MEITARSLNRSTLARQMLLEREPLGVSEAVKRLVALQAQMPPSPYVALWNRLTDFDPADLDAAFARHEVVKATLMRITLHAVHADDYPCFREAIEPSLFASTGIDRAEDDAHVEAMLEFTATPRTVDEIKAHISERTDDEASALIWPRLRAYTPIWHSPASGTWTFVQRPSFLAAHVLPVPDNSDSALREFVRRYLEGFGPASVADIAQFSLVQQARIKPALESLSSEVEQLEGPNGKPLFDVPGAPRPDEEVPVPPRLMAMWDSTLLAYKDRSRIIPPEYRKVVIRQNGDVLPTLLVDGYVAGLWRAVEGGIEVTAFHDLPDETWEGIAAEARKLTQFLSERDPEVYRRYNHWWDKMLDDVGKRVLLED